jgi:hypothetical protein
MSQGDTTMELSAAIRALTQAAQALTAVANQMMPMVQAPSPSRGALAAPPSQINTWEDDPFSEPVPTMNPAPATPLPVTVPVNNAPLLQTQIIDPQPAPGRYAPGTANFRYWMAAEALARGINFWAPLLPMNTRWSTANPMGVTLVTGQALNANYSRAFGLRFYQRVVRNITVYSAESPDVVCHELGHAILDALRPQLWNAASFEAAAFHESFGDMSSLLSALQLPTVRQKVLTETGGQLNITSRLSRLAEQLGWGIRQLSPTAVDPDCLRNAANRFVYQRPAQLPAEAPASQLSSAPHSFSRVFTGAFLDALALMFRAMGTANDASLLVVSRDMGQLLADGIRTAPIVPAYLSSVAASMIQADQARNQGRYRNALSSAFIQRGILSLATAATLSNAPVPQLMAVPAPPMARGGVGGNANGSQMLLMYGEGDDDGYQRGPEDAPELPIYTLTTDFGLTLLVHASAEPERFRVASTEPSVGSAEPLTAEEDVRAFLENVIRGRRIDFGSVQGIVPKELIAPPEEWPWKTHGLMDTPDGRILKRLHFECGGYGGY